MNSVSHKDFSNFKGNNFKKNEENNVINEFGKKGGAIWMNHKGNICIRTSLNSPYQELTATKAEHIMSVLLEKPIKIEAKKNIEEIKNKENMIHISEFLLIETVE